MARTLPNPSPHAPSLGASRLGSAASRMLALWHLCSLDAPTVAVAWALGFGWAARIRLPLWVPLLLALAAWAVYIADRLLDARAARRHGQMHRLRERHLFHWRNRWVLLPLAAVATCAAAWIVLALMPVGARQRDTLLGMAAFAYFSGVHGARKLPRLLPKELWVALLFTAACALPAISRMPSPSAPVLLVAAFFIALAWLNCHAIEKWEAEPAPLPPQPMVSAPLLALVGLLLAFALAPTAPRPAVLAAAGAAAALLLMMIDRLQERPTGWLTPLGTRIAADLALLTPVALLLR